MLRLQQKLTVSCALDEENLMIKNIARISFGLIAAFWTSGALAMCVVEMGKDGSGMQHIRNTCSVYVNFRWRDEGTCSTGCLETDIAPGVHRVISGMSGHVHATECQGRVCTPPM